MSNYHTTSEQIDKKIKSLDEAIAENGKQRWSVRRVFRMISTAVFTILFIGMSYILFQIMQDRSNGITPSVFGYQIYRVETGSMIPTFPIGTVIIAKEYDGSSDLAVGEVVTFQRGDKIITHRVVETLEGSNGQVYRTKGDNPENDVDLEVLTKDHVIATYQWTLPFIVQFHSSMEVISNGC